MSTTLKRGMDVQQSSEDLLRQARHAIDGVDQFFRDQGIDPETIHRVVPALMTDDIVAEVSAKFAEIKHEISRQVSQKRGEMSGEAGVTKAAPKRPRPMV